MDRIMTVLMTIFFFRIFHYHQCFKSVSGNVMVFILKFSKFSMIFFFSSETNIKQLKLGTSTKRSHFITKTGVNNLRAGAINFNNHFQSKTKIWDLKRGIVNFEKIINYLIVVVFSSLVQHCLRTVIVGTRKSRTCQTLHVFMNRFWKNNFCKKFPFFCRINICMVCNFYELCFLASKHIVFFKYFLLWLRWIVYVLTFFTIAAMLDCF